MTEATLLPPNFLQGTRVGVSVSESADLGRLGLTAMHCELAVAELARAIYVAGGTVMYGGRLVDGYSQILLDELSSYREDRDALILCVPETEWRRLSRQELRRRRDKLSASADLVCLDAKGNPVDIDLDDELPPTAGAAVGLTALRRFMTSQCAARVILGGRLDGYQGSMPGVIEEAILSASASQALYIAGGFGGAAAAIANELQLAPDEGPQDLAHAEAAAPFLSMLAQARSSVKPGLDGLDSDERAQLAVSYRPGDIASLMLTGLGRVSGIGE